MSKLRILITGSTGFVGERFTNILRSSLSNNAEIFTTSFTRHGENSIKVDLTDIKDVRKALGHLNSTHVYHFAAMVNPKLNEEKKLESFQKNFLITNNLANICSPETAFYFLSTDKVYNPDKKDSKEDEILEVPDNFYSLMKLICEEIIKAKFAKHFIFRCPIIHSQGDLSSNSFVDNATIKLSENQEIKAYTNVIRHYLLVDELVEFLCSLVNSDKFGTYNIGSEAASYYHRIAAIAKMKKLDIGLISKDTGQVSPQIQLLNLAKFKNTFSTIFN
uniref:NAD-dependent epimerase/dehydratase family protein n=1 Tax=Algoriphagus sp. TaxID=1872435 RepID=UPI00404759A0